MAFARLRLLKLVGRGDTTVGFWDYNDQYFHQKTQTWVAKWKWNGRQAGGKANGGKGGKKKGK